MSNQTKLNSYQPSCVKPTSLAATVLYVTCSKTGEYFSLKEIAKAAGVTEVTIRTRFRDLKTKNLI